MLSPILLVTAIAIKATDHGPVFYKQVRLTKNGREFNIFKFRSMCVDAEKMALRDSRRVIKMIVSRQLVELSGLAALTNCHSSSIF